jgi:alpha-galactosidase
VIRKLFAATIVVICLVASTCAQKPVKVYILAGQSNMVGTGKISTFDYIGDDPATAPLLSRMRGDDGNPTVCDRVWISSLNGKMNQYGGEGFGKLTAGYGVRINDPTELGDSIGPEFTFGLAMEDAYDGPILLIKTAWGGQSLSVDYRSPGSGPYKLNDWQIENFTAKGVLEKIKAEREEATGRNYRYMIEHVQKVLADIKRVYPQYDSEAGYELSGFVWFQGWNDYVDVGTYRDTEGDQQYAPYGTVLAQFIRDVRKDLESPELPFVIGVSGIHGDFTPGTFNARGQAELRMRRFRKAMAAPALLPEFNGNVVAVETAAFHDLELGRIGIKMLKVKQFSAKLRNQNKDKPEEDKVPRTELIERVADYRAEVVSPAEEALWKRAASRGGFVHYYGSAKFHAQAGNAFANALTELEK